MVNEDGEIFSNIKSSFLKFSKNKDGYLRTCLKLKNNKKKNFYVHRLVAEMFVDKNNNSTETIDHIDGDKCNNNYKNLRWCSFKENIKYAHENEINNQKCECNSQTKLTNLTVEKIITDILNHNYTLKDISKKYNCSYDAVKRINQKISFIPIWDKILNTPPIQ